MSSIVTFDPSLLLSYYGSQLSTFAPAQAPAPTAKSSATAHDAPPWQDYSKKVQQEQDAKILSTKDFFDLSKVPLHASTADEKTEQDNQKLFALYQAVNTLSYIAGMSKRDGMTAGQLAGFNTRFQAGFGQLQDFLSKTKFNNFSLESAKPGSSVTSTITVPLIQTDYAGASIATGDAVTGPVSGVSSTDKFTISITKAGVKTDVAVDLSGVSGALTLDNIVTYANQQLEAQGFSSRLRRVLTDGSINDPANASYGIAVEKLGGESLAFSAASAQPALYLAGTSGTNVASNDVAADQQGRLVKLGSNGTTFDAVFNATFAPTSGNTTATATVVDANGNVYVLGTATGDVGNLLNQGTQDVYLTKYDSAGNVAWKQLLGSAGSASGYALALDPTGGVVITGSTTSQVMSGAVADGNADSFVARYTADGTQSWVKQIQTLAKNESYAVAVSQDGTVHIGGGVTGSIGAGQVNAGGSDAYLATFDATGKLLAETQFGTASDDKVSAVAATSTGDLLVATVQNGHAIVSKYAAGDITSPALWSRDLGDLGSNGMIGGLAVSGSDIYVSGSTRNPSLDAGGEASVAAASSGNLDSFVLHLTDNGASATADTVSYVGTGANDTAGNVVVGSGGTVYLTGTTQGTFAGQQRSVENVPNAFISAIGADGTVSWTRQFGGASGQSTGAALALDSSGASVLDALGLPRGSVDVAQSVDLTSQTTLRAGDSFSIKIAGAAGRTANITISKGETLNSLATKINAALMFKGKASVVYGHGGKNLKIEVNDGVTATLISGPEASDALARLGIASGTLTKKGSTPDGSTDAQVFGLGLPSHLDISTTSGASLARAQLLGVLTAIRDAYRTTNTQPSSNSAIPANSGTVSAYQSAQLNNYSLALQLQTAIAANSQGTA